MSCRKVALTLYLRQMAAPSEWTVQRSGQWWDWALRNEDRYWWRSNFRMSKCLSKRLDCSLNHIIDTVAACVILHNLCEVNGDSFMEEWQTPHTSSPDTQQSRTNSTTSSKEVVRDAIAQYFSS